MYRPAAVFCRKQFFVNLRFYLYKSRPIIVASRHIFTVINMNDTPIPIGQIC